MEKKITFWLSYDLGLKGDYNSFYKWLDRQKAKECGDSIAVFEYLCLTNNPKEEIKYSLEKEISFNKSDTVYLIWKDENLSSFKGSFIIGHRKSAPWDGYFVTDAEEAFDS